MGAPHKPDADRKNEPATPTKTTPEDGKPPFAFIERPHVEREVYISRPELGRDPAKRDK